jgi:hypothetical protein
VSAGRSDRWKAETRANPRVISAEGAVGSDLSALSGSHLRSRDALAALVSPSKSRIAWVAALQVGTVAAFVRRTGESRATV